MRSTQNKHLATKSWLAAKFNIILMNLKKRRYEIQDCEDFQSCRTFIAEKSAIHLILDIKTVKAGELKIKLSFNLLEPIMTKQQSIG